MNRSNIATMTAPTVEEILSKRILKDNANVPSDISWDLVGNLEQAAFNLEIGNPLPFACSLANRETEPSLTQKDTRQCISDLTRLNFFENKLAKLLEARFREMSIPEKNLGKRIEALYKDRQFLNSFTTIGTFEQFNKDLKLILNYREQIEFALFARRQSHLNCGEQAALAYLDFLLEAKQASWPQELAVPIHLIRISAGPKIQHAFLLFGDNSLEADIKIQGKKSVYQRLHGLNGRIYDPWNNPRSGGLFLPAAEARQSHRFYGRQAPQIWDELEITYLPSYDVHAMIKQRALPLTAKKILQFSAGPSLEQIIRGVPALSERLLSNADNQLQDQQENSAGLRLV